jgi:hypothetical protein
MGRIVVQEALDKETGRSYEVLDPKVGTKKEPTMTPPRMTRLRGRLQKDMVDIDVRCSKVTGSW